MKVETKSKTWQTAVQSAFIKTNTFAELLKIGIPTNIVKGHPQTLLKIKIEVDTDPAPAHRTETRFLKIPLNIGIRSVVLEDIFAAKMHALLFREWKGRVKGRDWYDWLWMVRNDVTLNLERLSIHLTNSGFLKPGVIVNPKAFQQLMYEKIETLDLEAVFSDLRPFIFNSDHIRDWSKDMLRSFVNETRVKY